MYFFTNKIIKTIQLILMSSILASPCFAESKIKHIVEDLSYGESLFHFFQGKHFSAISDILVAKHYQKLSNEDKNPELLLGGLYLSYGLHHKSADVFSKILAQKDKPEEIAEDKNDSDSSNSEEAKSTKKISAESDDDGKLTENSITPLPIRDRAWFHLGKNHYEHGFLEDAKQAFTSIKDTLNDNYNSERLFILANIHVKTNELDKALEVMDHFDDSIWKEYAYFNVGTALIKSNRIDEGIALLLKLAEIDIDISSADRERQILKDKAIIALAYTALMNEKPLEATKYFQTARLNDNEATKALLGIGWSLYKQKEFNQALIPWMELASRTPSDPSVQEALISIPYVFEQINNHHQALHQYNMAIDSYNKQLVEINKVIEIINNGDFIKRLNLDTLGKESATPFSILFNINAQSNQYLLPLVSSNDFHEALKTYQELTYLNFTLNQWERDLPALHLILKEKIHTYNTKLKGTIHNPKLKLSKTMQKKRNMLAEKIQLIESTENATMLASSEEQETLDLLSHSKSRLNNLKDTEDLSEEEEKLKLLSGLMNWKIETDYKPRIWQAKKELKELDKVLYEMHGAIYSLSNAWKSAPEKFKGFSLKIKDKGKRIAELKKRMDASLKLQETYLQSMAMKVINTHHNRLKLYHDRALFAKARIYDSLIVKSDYE
jgi:tetratricopeptide (TPR) repeat protein